MKMKEDEHLKTEVASKFFGQALLRPNLKATWHYLVHKPAWKGWNMQATKLGHRFWEVQLIKLLEWWKSTLVFFKSTAHWMPNNRAKHNWTGQSQKKEYGHRLTLPHMTSSLQGENCMLFLLGYILRFFYFLFLLKLQTNGVIFNEEAACSVCRIMILLKEEKRPIN